MECIVTTEDDGTTRRYVGNTVCDGPGQHRLILTRPYQDAGQIVEIPTTEIETIEKIDEPEIPPPGKPTTKRF